MGYDFRLPDVGEGVAEAEIVRWLVDEGSMIAQDQPVVEVQTDKAIVELPSPVSGIVNERRWVEGSTVPVGEILFVIQEEDEVCSVQRSNPESTRSLAAPSVRRLAKEFGIALHKVRGTGKDGRIMEVDLHRYVQDECVESSAPISTMMKENESTRVQSNEVSELPLSSIRRVIGERLLYSVTHKPHAIHFDEVDVGGMVAWRDRMVREEGFRITYTAILLKLIAYTLKKHALFNAHFNEETQKIHLFSSLSIGMATDTPKGLLVPVLHEVEKKNMLQISSEVSELSQLTRDGKCSVDQMKGSTFTISNAGSLGGKWAVPIINPPEVAILAIHPIEQRPVVDAGSIVPGWRMNVSLAFDHRVLDGADAIRFTQTLGRYTSDPGRILHELV